MTIKRIALSDAWGAPIWIKRDDLTGFGLSGNKVRKLELHLAAAADAGATTLITCGAVQSNHGRATAIAGARQGFRTVLFLRSSDGSAPDVVTGNHLLQRLTGAEVRFITPDQWRDVDAIMEAHAAELAATGEIGWTMPSGASDELGVQAFDLALGELDEQVGAVPEIASKKVTVWHASSSAGTTAGLAVGAQRSDRSWHVVGSSVGDPESYLGPRVAKLAAEVGAPDAEFEIVDDWIGLGYGKTTDEELAVQVEGTRLTGLIWDPTYTGKALYALKQEISKGRFDADDAIVFWHTGGGFAAFAHDYSVVL